MIVNVNPYDTGFDENSHVMKFSAVAKDVTTVRTHIPPPMPPSLPSSMSIKRLPLQARTSSEQNVNGIQPIVEGDVDRSLQEGDTEIVEALDDEDEDEDDEDDGFVDHLLDEIRDLRVQVRNVYWLGETVAATDMLLKLV